MTNIFEEWDHVYDGKIKTAIITDSYLTCDGVRVTTFLLRVPRFILPEITRHRIYSFSIDSSRARSNDSKAANIYKDTFVPELPLAEHKGMQGNDFLTDKQLKDCKTIWYLAMHDMINYAQQMHDLGLSHQYTNRLLEPFMYTDILMTGTTWKNFIELRTDENAQFEVQVSARQIQELLNNNEPTYLENSEFHLPFISSDDKLNLSVFEQTMVSVARCARTSYIDPTESSHSTEKNIELAKKLLQNKHLSPFEHIVQNLYSNNLQLKGNLCGGLQLRKLLEKMESDLELFDSWTKF